MWVDATLDCEFEGHFEGHKGQTWVFLAFY